MNAPSLRELTSRILARNGCQVCVAADGADALRQVEDPAQPLDLLLTDVVMPKMLGHELEIGQVLRHAQPGTTAIYAKTDMLALSPLARPWPGGSR